MACMWEGKKFEPYTVRMLAMLYAENNALDPRIRGDYGFAFGLSQEHICNRGLNMYYLGIGYGVKRYCYSRNGMTPTQQVEKEFPEFSFSWTSQFYYFSNFISPKIDEGKTPNAIVTLWNSNEIGRQAIVDRHEPFIKAVLNIK